MTLKERLRDRLEKREKLQKKLDILDREIERIKSGIYQDSYKARKKGVYMY